MFNTFFSSFKIAISDVQTNLLGGDEIVQTIRSELDSSRWIARTERLL